jgi:hypothetical protein
LHDERQPSEVNERFGAGIADAVILPLVVIGVAAKTVLRWAWRLLVRIVDDIFPILLQVARFVLFTFRILGDGVSALLRFVIRYLPLPGARRQNWREAVARGWSWLRRKVSYRAFEEWLHHLFEDGMAWVFKTCRKLSPGGALLVIVAALVWMPVSFMAATAVHAWLIADAASLPKWMQVFHVVAAVLAKSKLLMLPAYPAAWPQAKQHLVVQALARVWRFIVGLYLVRKTRYRFGQTEDAADRAAAAIGRAAAAAGLVRPWQAVVSAVDGAVTGTIGAARAVLRPPVLWLAKLPVAGPVLRTYASHYDRAGKRPSERLSEKVRAFLQRWELKFTPAYYEAKEKEETAKGKAASAATPSAQRSAAP